MSVCIQWAMCSDMGLQVTHKFYEHTREMIMNVNGTTIMWDVLKTGKPSKYKDLKI
jgi:hypothetical protein